MHKNLKDLGKRICIIGPSSSGKSTLADRLASKIGCDACHLDQLAHKENTNWERRPNADFIADHDAVIQKNSWVIDGNYSVCMPQRFARSTAVIWINPPLVGAIWHNIKRSITNDATREGNLKGATKQLNFFLLTHTLFKYPKNCEKYQRLLEDYTKPIVQINSMQELNRYYADWGINLKK